MNKKIEALRRIAPRSGLLMAGLLLLFVGGIYGISSLYTLGKPDVHTFILPAGQPASSLGEVPRSTFKIESVIRQSLPYPIYMFQAMDDNTIVLNRPGKSLSGIKLSLLKMEENEVNDIAANVDYGITPTSDYKQVVYASYGKNWDEMQMYTYNLATGESSSFSKLGFYLLSFIDDHSYIGVDIKQPELIHFIDQQQREFISYEDLTRFIAKASGSKIESDVFLFEDFQVSSDKQAVYFSAKIQNGYGIYRYELEGSNHVTEIATSEEIHQFIELNTGNFLIVGSVQGKSGLFVFNQTSGSHKLLKEGAVWNIELDKERSRLAFLSVKENLDNELHAAYLEEDELVADTVIYRNIEGVQQLQWHDNQLFLSSSSAESGELYRFTLNAW